jgi:prepilin-type N-terminal cleavage/methylation domain-containing protein
MKTSSHPGRRGFTLAETVIAIGILSVLLTGFIVVFTPAADGIRKSINSQQADRLTSTLEQELVTLRTGESSSTIATGFDKAFKLIQDSMVSSSPEVVFVYQYRGDLRAALRTDGTYSAYSGNSGVVGADFTVVSMARRRIKLDGSTDTDFEQDLSALEGRAFAVKMTQLVFSTDATKPGLVLPPPNTSTITDPTPDPINDPSLTGNTAAGRYQEAVIAFSAEFFSLPSSSYSYLKTGGAFSPVKLKNPMFSRNLAVRR